MVIPDSEAGLADLTDLTSITAEVVDLDLIELVQLGLVRSRLELSERAVELIGEASQFVIRDIEATPLLLATRDGGWVDLRVLRPVDPGFARPKPAQVGVVVAEPPSPAELAALSATAGPITWLVLASRTRAGRRLLHQLTQARPAPDQVVRVPWPSKTDQALFERPELPPPADLAAAFAVAEVSVFGDLTKAGIQPPQSRGGAVIFFTGLSGSGKSTIAKALHAELEQLTDREVTLLDGDDVRRLLTAGLGFDAAGRAANVRRVSWVAALLARGGGIAITALIAPFAAGRAEAREFARQAGADFIEVWVATSLAECERRDRKGLYAQARAGLIPEFTGIGSPYDQPMDPEVTIDTAQVGVGEAVAMVLAELSRRADRKDPSGPASGRWERDGVNGE